MDTNAIRLFVIAADLLNISAAGKRLNLAPSVASAKLAKLEVQVGADLFHRSTRKVSLSVEGEAFLPYARDIIAQEDGALAALGQGEANVAGTLRFAASSTFAQRFIMPLLPEFLDAYPNINLELKLSDTQHNIIESGFDLALRNYAVEDSSLIGRKLAEDKRILCAAPDYLARAGTPSTPDDLKAHRLLVFMHAKPRKIIAHASNSIDFFPPEGARSRVICDDGASMRLAAVAGTGICMSSVWNVQAELDRGSLVRVLPEYTFADNAAIWLVYPRSNVLTGKVRVFIDFLVDKIAPLPIWQT